MCWLSKPQLKRIYNKQLLITRITSDVHFGWLIIDVDTEETEELMQKGAKLNDSTPKEVAYNNHERHPSSKVY